MLWDLLFFDFFRFFEVESDLRGIIWELVYIVGDKVFYVLLWFFLVCSWFFIVFFIFGLLLIKFFCYYILFEFMKGI